VTHAERCLRSVRRSSRQPNQGWDMAKTPLRCRDVLT
jgi:hypothetical protein